MNKTAAALLVFVAVTGCAAGDHADADAQATNAVSKPSVFPEHDAMPHRKGNRTLEIFAKTSSESNFESIAVHHGKLGYDPADSCHYAGKCDLTSKPNSTIDFKMGLYRHSDATHAVAFFDTVRLTTTFATAVPDYQCSM